MKFLIIAPAWVGDMVMAQSLFKAIRSEYPDAVLDVAAPAWSLPVIGRMPEVRKRIALSAGHGQLHLAGRIRTGRSLAGEAYDRAIVLPRTWKSALIPFFAKIPVRTGFRGELRYGLINDMRKLDKTVLSMTVLRYLALGQEKDAKIPPEIRFYPELRADPENRDRLVQSLALRMDRPVVVFCPGAEYGPAKQWPLDHYQRLADMLIADGFQVWTLGSSKEAEAADRIDPGSGSFVNLCGRTRLEDVVDLMGLAACAVTNDSGLMHVAAASGIPVQAIYGSSSPSYTPPLTTRADIHCLGMACSPCFKRQCPAGHLDCLKDISPEAVHRAIRARTADG